MFTSYPQRDCEPSVKSDFRQRILARRIRGHQAPNGSLSEHGRHYATRHVGGSKLGMLVALSAITAVCVYACQHVFNRAGEAAIQLIPADARMVVTLDLTPSPEQALTFKRIADAMKREGLDTQLDSAVSRMLTNTPIARDLRPYTLGSMAFATLKSSNAPASNALAQTGLNGDMALFVAINNVDKVKSVLAHDARRSNVNGLDYYQTTGDTRCMAVLGSYLVTTDLPEDLTRIEAVRRGEKPPIASLTDYKQARASLPADSNMMMFVSESAVAEGVQQTGQSTLSLRNASIHTHYVATGMAIRAEGIDFVLLSPLDPPQGLGSGQSSRFTPLSDTLWRKLPSGAYGMMAYSQPGKAYNYMMASIHGDADSKRMVEEAVAGFQRETGLSVTRDLLPAMMGNVVLAVYPDADNPKKSVDGLIVLDDTNSADPTGLAERVRALIERQTARNGGTAWHFISEERHGAKVWTLDAASQQTLRHSIGGSTQDVLSLVGVGGPANGRGNSGTPGSDATGAQRNADVQSVIGNKTLTFAQIGHAVLIATSPHMLDRAIAAYSSGVDTLADDADYTRMRHHVAEGTQNVFFLAIPSIMEASRPALTKALAGSHTGISPDDILHIVGTPGVGLVGTQQYDGKTVKMTMFLPMDYDKVLHLVKAVQNIR